MGDKTGIAWCDASWNPCTGCSKVSQGCRGCYAESVADRFWPTQYPPVWVGSNADDDTAYRPRRFTDVQCHPERLDQPLRWTRPRLIFVNSMSDLFHDQIPDAFVTQVFDVMRRATQHRFQVLTKRSRRMQRFCAAMPPLSNVRLGVSVENAETAMPRLADLMAVSAAGWTTMVSFEPLLGPLDCGIPWPDIGWAIIGGETGRNFREMPMEGTYGARRLAIDVLRYGIPLFVKQDSGLRPGSQGRWDEELWAKKEFPK